MNTLFRIIFVTFIIAVLCNADVFAQQMNMPPNITYATPQPLTLPSVTYEERVTPLVCTVTRMFGMPDTVTISIAADVDIGNTTIDTLKTCVEGAKKQIPNNTTKEVPNNFKKGSNKPDLDS